VAARVARRPNHFEADQAPWEQRVCSFGGGGCSGGGCGGDGGGGGSVGREGSGGHDVTSLAHGRA